MILDRFSRLNPFDKFLVVGSLALMALQVLLAFALDLSPIRTTLAVLVSVVMLGFYPFMRLAGKE